MARKAVWGSYKPKKRKKAQVAGEPPAYKK